MKHEQVLLVGYFDRGNLGDDLMRDALRATLADRLPGVRITTASFPRFGPGGLPGALRFLAALRRADTIMLAGGTHLHDAFGPRSWRILATMLACFAWARLWGARVSLAGVGIGPVRTRPGATLIRAILATAEGILVRDDASAEIAHGLGADDVHIGADLALLPSQHPAPARAPHAPTLGVSLVPYFSLYEGNPDHDCWMVDAVAEAVTSPRLRCGTVATRFEVMFRGRGQNDVAMARSLRAAIAPGDLAVVAPRSSATALAEFANLNALLAMRYHAAILGYLAGVPMLVVTYEPKCRAFAEQVGLPPEALLSPRDLLDPRCLETRLAALLSRPDGFRPSIPPSRLRARAQAGLDALLTDSSLGGER
jgi:polysaccharide pyruvyl transferase WcaK-like protein